MRNKQSFTLIEILIVIAILAGLTSLLVPNFMDVRMRSRDAKRKTDLHNMQKALELYKQNQTPQTYPSALPTPCTSFGDTVLASVVYMQKTPNEPLTSCSSQPKGYYYVPVLPDTYTLYACLEDEKDPDGISCPNGFSTNTGFTCTKNKCYKLTEP